MAMTYAEFKTYLATFLWKQNDTDLVANLDNLILMANAELNRTLDIQERELTLLAEPTSQDFALPADFRGMNSVNNLSQTSGSAFQNTTELDVFQKRHASQSTHVMPFYAVSQGVSGGKLLRLVGPYTVLLPGSLVIVYLANIPNYAVTGVSWVEDLFLDLYVYTVLSHAAPFLREDERVGLWDKNKTEALASSLQLDKHKVKYGGSPMTMQPAHAVPNDRRR